MLWPNRAASPFLNDEEKILRLLDSCALGQQERYVATIPESCRNKVTAMTVI